MINTKERNELNDYQNIDIIANNHPQFSKNQLRWIVANKERYQISHAIKRIGKKIYFHVPSLVAWVETRSA